MPAHCLNAFLQSVLMLGGIGARGPQDGAAAWQNAGHGAQVELHGLVLHHTAPAFQEPGEFVLVMEAALAHYGADYGI